MTVKDLVNHFLIAKKHLVDTREIAQRTWDDYDATCQQVMEVLGRGRVLADLRPEDFESLRRHFAKGHGIVTLGNDTCIGAKPLHLTASVDAGSCGLLGAGNWPRNRPVAYSAENFLGTLAVPNVFGININEDKRVVFNIMEDKSEKSTNLGVRPMSDESQGFGPLADEPNGDFHETRGLLDALRKVRLRKGFGLGEVSERSGIDRATLSKLENGVLNNPTVQTLNRIADALGVRIKWRIIADASVTKEIAMENFSDVLDSLNAADAGAALAEADTEQALPSSLYDRNADLDEFVRNELGATGQYLPVYEDLAQQQLESVRTLCFDRVANISDADAKQALVVMRRSLIATAGHSKAEEWRRCLHAIADYVLRSGPLTGPRAALVCEALVRISGYFHHPVGLYAAFRQYARDLIDVLFGRYGINLPYFRITGGDWEDAVPGDGDLVTLWDFAGKDLARASRILCFIASPRHRFDRVYTTAERHAELRRRAANDESVLYRWSVSSPSVALIAKSVAVHRKDLVEHLNIYGFDQEVMKNPDRRARDQWFESIKLLPIQKPGAE